MPKPETESRVGNFWRFSVRLRDEVPDPEARRLKADIADLEIEGVEKVAIAHVYYLEGDLSEADRKRIGQNLLIDPITQTYDVQAVSNPQSAIRNPQSPSGHTVEVAYHPGVRDPVEDSLKKGAIDLGITAVRSVHTAKVYTFVGSLKREAVDRIGEKLLVNATIQQVVTPENLVAILRPSVGTPLTIETVHLLEASDTVLQRVSIDHQLSLNLEEMKAVQAYFRGQSVETPGERPKEVLSGSEGASSSRSQGREPTLIELETIAQTWSEHCKHKTLRGPIHYTEEVEGKTQKRMIGNLMKETIMRVTEELKRPWCISVFQDNSGVIAFDDQFHACFKVETHNHPSALEPFGGASTGIGGVIRDILGTGLGAKPVASTDIFCFAPPDLPADRVPLGVLAPRRIIKGVVAGVKDYGNKMGIPTVNGAVLFDERFVGNPLVYCGNVGLLPVTQVAKQPRTGMTVVLVGGRTGRDGIHGATFSSLGLHAESEVISATAVQIGDPITEKKTADALLEARDQELFTSVPDCGAGGLSSAVGEMGAECGARVDLEKVPLKYLGLTPTEIWISESQERMVLAVPPERLDRLIELFRVHGVEATAIGEFTDTSRLELFYGDSSVGTLEMAFLHDGVPQITRPARWVAPSIRPSTVDHRPSTDLTVVLMKLLSRWETCSKEWIIRQYDHEVQGGSALKPLVGVGQRGPSDAAVIRPRLDSNRGLVLANGINFRYGDLDPYWMAALCIEEALRQVIAVGGTLDRVAILDNFCWGNPTRPEVLGSLVRAALGCYDAAKAFGVPFISGKDSLHNEYKVADKTIQIPGTLLISAIGVMEDVTRLVSMDAKRAGNLLYLVGSTKPELGGSAYQDLIGSTGGSVPQVDFQMAPALLKGVGEAISRGWVVAAHDCSEGGLAVAAAEMAFAGGLGLELDLKGVPLVAGTGGTPLEGRDDWVLFSESATRLLLEVPPEKEQEFRQRYGSFPMGQIGQFAQGPGFRAIGLAGKPVIESTIDALREAWEAPFRGW